MARQNIILSDNTENNDAILSQIARMNDSATDMDAINRRRNYEEAWVRQLTLIDTSLFSYENLPVAVPATWIESTFLMNGGVIATKKPLVDVPGYDGSNDVLFYPAGTGTGLYDQYGMPLQVQAIGPTFNGSLGNRTYDLRNYDNTGKIVEPEAYLGIGTNMPVNSSYQNGAYPLGTPNYEYLLIQNYAKILANYQMVQDVNIDAQRTPYVLNGNQFTKNGSNALINQLMSGVSYIVNQNPGNKAIDTSKDIQVMNTVAPFVAERIQEILLARYNEVITMLGLPAVTSKRERVVVSEATANNSQSALIAQSKLNLRQKWVDDFNNAFGTNVKVNMNLPTSDSDDISQTDESRDLSDDVNDGEIDDQTPNT